MKYGPFIVASIATLLAGSTLADAGDSGSGRVRRVFDWTSPKPEQISPNPTSRRGGRPYLRRYAPVAGGSGEDVVVDVLNEGDEDLEGREITSPGAGGSGDGSGGGSGSSAEGSGQGAGEGVGEGVGEGQGGDPQVSGQPAGQGEDGEPQGGDPQVASQPTGQGEGGEPQGSGPGEAGRGEAGLSADGSQSGEQPPAGVNGEPVEQGSDPVAPLAEGGNGEGAGQRAGEGGSGPQAYGPDLSALDWNDSEANAAVNQLVDQFQRGGFGSSGNARGPGGAGVGGWHGGSGGTRMALSNAPASVTGHFTGVGRRGGGVPPAKNGSGQGGSGEATGAGPSGQGGEGSNQGLGNGGSGADGTGLQPSSVNSSGDGDNATNGDAAGNAVGGSDNGSDGASGGPASGTDGAGGSGGDGSPGGSGTAISGSGSGAGGSGASGSQSAAGGSGNGNVGGGSSSGAAGAGGSGGDGSAGGSGTAISGSGSGAGSSGPGSESAASGSGNGNGGGGSNSGAAGAGGSGGDGSSGGSGTAMSGSDSGAGGSGVGGSESAAGGSGNGNGGGGSNSGAAGAGGSGGAGSGAGESGNGGFSSGTAGAGGSGVSGGSGMSGSGVGGTSSSAGGSNSAGGGGVPTGGGSDGGGSGMSMGGGSAPTGGGGGLPMGGGSDGGASGMSMDGGNAPTGGGGGLPMGGGSDGGGSGMSMGGAGAPTGGGGGGLPTGGGSDSGGSGMSMGGGGAPTGGGSAPMPAPAPAPAPIDMSSFESSGSPVFEATGDAEPWDDHELVNGFGEPASSGDWGYSEPTGGDGSASVDLGGAPGSITGDPGYFGEASENSQAPTDSGVVEQPADTPAVEGEAPEGQPDTQAEGQQTPDGQPVEAEPDPRNEQDPSQAANAEQPPYLDGPQELPNPQALPPVDGQPGQQAALAEPDTGDPGQNGTAVEPSANTPAVEGEAPEPQPDTQTEGQQTPDGQQVEPEPDPRNEQDPSQAANAEQPPYLNGPQELPNPDALPPVDGQPGQQAAPTGPETPGPGTAVEQPPGAPGGEQTSPPSADEQPAGAPETGSEPAGTAPKTSEAPPAGAPPAEPRPVVFGEVKEKLGAMENPTQALTDMMAVKDGTAKVEDFTGQRAENLRVAQDLDARSGGLREYVKVQLVLQKDLEAEQNGMTAALEKDIKSSTYAAQFWGSAVTLGHATETAIQATIAAGTPGWSEAAIAVDKGYTAVQTATNKAMELGDMLEAQFSPPVGAPTADNTLGTAAAGPGQSAVAVASEPPGAAVQGGPSTVERLTATPGALHTAVKDLTTAGRYAQTRDRNLVMPPENSPATGSDVVGSALGGVDNAGKVYGALKEREAAVNRGDDDAARMATYKAIDYGVKTTGKLVETGQNFQAWRNGQAVDPNGKTTKFMVDVSRISSAPIAVESYGQMWRAKTDAERAQAFERAFENTGTAVLGEKGGKFGKGIGGAAVSIVNSRDAYARGDDYEGRVSALEGGGKAAEGISALLPKGVVKTRVEAAGKGAQSAAKGLRTGREVVQFTAYRNQLLGAAQFTGTKMKTRNNIKLLEGMNLVLDPTPVRRP